MKLNHALCVRIIIQHSRPVVTLFASVSPPSPPLQVNFQLAAVYLISVD